MRRKKLLIISLFLIALAIFSFTLLSEEAKAPKVKSWKMPDFLHENLLNLKRNFELQFQARLDQYFEIMRTRFDEFKDMPKERGSLVFDLETGQILTKEDYIKLIEQAKAKQAQIAPKEQKNEKESK